MDDCSQKPSTSIKIERYDEDYFDDVEIEEAPTFDNTFHVTSTTSNDERQRVDIIHIAANANEMIKEEPIFDEETVIYGEHSGPEANERTKNTKNTKNTKKTKKAAVKMDNANEMTKVEPIFDEETVVDRENSGPEANEQMKNTKNTKKAAAKMDSPAAIHYECYLCKTTMKYPYNLNRHFSERHIDRKMFACKICDKTFPRQETLALHESVHTRTKYFECKFCKRSFAQKVNLRRHNYSCGPSAKHLAIYGSNRAFECYLCKFQCDIDSLRKHMSQHISHSNFDCIICGVGFDRSQHLAKHMKIHTHYKPFECNECFVKFTRKRNLKRHQRIHTRSGLFVCSYCRKKFTTKYALQIHERNHTGVKPFACHICDKHFARNDYLKSHIARVHK